MSTTPPLKTALLFNLKRVDPSSGDDSEAEFDRLATVDAVRSALLRIDLDVSLIEANESTFEALQMGGFAFAVNIAEGRHGRSREAQIPAILDFLRIPYAGSDPTTLAIAHDKALAKRIVGSFHLKTPAFEVLGSPDDPIPNDLRYPLFVKPLHEGTSKGIGPESVCRTPGAVRETAGALLRRYGQPVLVEEFLSGREFTVGILGNDPALVLPILEIVHQDASVPAIYDFDAKIERRFGLAYPCPAPLEAGQRRAIEDLARGAFRALGCRDVARVDVRLDGEGVPNFIELNPLPGLAPNFSDLVTIAKAGGLDYDELVATIALSALRRAGLRS